MTKKKGLMAAVLLGLAVILSAGCGQQAVQKNTHRRNLPHLRIGCDLYPPFNYLDADGNPMGIDVDLAKEAASRMGYEPEFIFIDWEDKSSLLEEGEVDCVWSSFSINGREDLYQWAGPYMYSHQVVAVNPDSDIHTLQDLEGKTIAVQSTTKPEEIFLSKSDPRIPELGDIFSLQKRELLYPFLSKGYVDAIAAHDTTIQQFMSDYNVEYRILDEPLQTVGLGAAFSKSDTRGIAQELTRTFDEMREDGTTREILGKYLDDVDRYLEVDDDER